MIMTKYLQHPQQAQRNFVLYPQQQRNVSFAAIFKTVELNGPKYVFATPTLPVS